MWWKQRSLRHEHRWPWDFGSCFTHTYVCMYIYTYIHILYIHKHIYLLCFGRVHLHYIHFLYTVFVQHLMGDPISLASKQSLWKYWEKTNKDTYSSEIHSWGSTQQCGTSKTHSLMSKKTPNRSNKSLRGRTGSHIRHTTAAHTQIHILHPS